MADVVKHSTPATAATAGDAFTLQLVPRQCHLRAYNAIPVPSFSVEGEIIAYASPDSTYAVTKSLLDKASMSILIGIYDFTAPYVRDTLLQAVQRGVRVQVMLDLDGRKGEPEVWEELKQGGCAGIAAPSCASRVARYFASSHEKVIVIDDTWTLVQSGNYSENSIPENKVDGGDPAHWVSGNRDMGLAVNSRSLSEFFTQVLAGDIKLELDGEQSGQVQGLGEPFQEISLAAAGPSHLPPKRFSSKNFHPLQSIQVQPVLSPDNYMSVIPDFIASAQHSIYIEQQYIRAKQPEIQKLLGAIRSAMDRNNALDVRIVLALPFAQDVDKEIESLQAMETFGLKLGTHVRYLNPRYLVHCHNKLAIVDNQAVLVSSQNWSDTAVTKNREAGLLVQLPDLAQYYADIFNTDWGTALKTPKQAGQPQGPIAGPLAGVPNRMPVRVGDYLEV